MDGRAAPSESRARKHQYELARAIFRGSPTTPTPGPPPDTLGATHWSTRLIATHLGIGDATVARAWRRYCIKPWGRETLTGQGC